MVTDAQNLLIKDYIRCVGNKTKKNIGKIEGDFDML